MFYNQAKKKALKSLQDAEANFNKLATEANDKALELYSLRKSAVKAIERVEKYVNTLANTPKEFEKEIAEVRKEIGFFSAAVEIEKENASANIKGAGAAAGGMAAGGAVAALGPTAAMAIATTFGTASTGTAIASLSGAAAVNASLAWLGGGALAAGGGGMAAGNALLALAGPVGWGLAGVFIVGGGAFSAIKNKKAAEKAQEKTIEILKATTAIQPKVAELEKLCKETAALKSGLDIALMVNTYPADYADFTTDQKHALGAVINNVRSMGKLISKKVG